MKNLKAYTIAALAAALAAALLSGCAAAKPLQETDVGYAGAMLDQVLSGIRDKDYAAFSKDFGNDMKAAMPEDSFNTLTDTLETKIGDYESRSFFNASQTSSKGIVYDVVVYKAKYTLESGDVTVTISFCDENGAKVVGGLFFNSSNLAK
jgi:hypothetical protein